VKHIVTPVDPRLLDAAETLLERFFREESFVVARASVRANLAALIAEPGHWAGLAWRDSAAVGVVTVTTALYVEWGRLGEIGDLYVLPEARGQGVARALIDAAVEQCRACGCSAASITITPVGESNHGLTQFYARLGFVPSGRTSASLPLG
jgi:GNAT superfamily N-acetyltransferase